MAEFMVLYNLVKVLNKGTIIIKYCTNNKMMWFTGDLTSKFAIMVCLNVGVGFPMFQEGTYLIRSSAKDPSKPYTLSLFYKRKVWHLHLRLRSDGMFAVGSEKPEEEV